MTGDVCMIDLKTIHYIKAIAEEGSFQKVAASLYISQPALSQYIKRIENELSFPLYERQNGKCVLTPPGEILLQKGSDILSQFDTMIEEMKICANSQKKDIYFGCPTGYSVPWFSEFLLNCKHFSDCEYHLSEDSVEALINMLAKKKLDIVFIPAIYYHPDIIYRTICHEAYYLAVPNGHTINKTIEAHNEKGTVDLSTLDELAFISGPAKAYTEFIRPLFEDAELDVNTIFVAKNWDIAHSMVERGIGTTIVPYWFTHHQNNYVNYYRIVSSKKTYRIFAYAMRNQCNISAETQHIIDYIIQKCGDIHAHEIVEPTSLILDYMTKAPLSEIFEE